MRKEVDAVVSMVGVDEIVLSCFLDGNDGPSIKVQAALVPLDARRFGAGVRLSVHADGGLRIATRTMSPPPLTDEERELAAWVEQLRQD